MCRACGRFAPTKKVLFVQHIGAIILMFHKRIGGEMCRGCIDQYFSQYTLTTLFLGWWGVASFFITPCVLVYNVVRYLFTLGSGREGKRTPATTLQGHQP
jgi:hypothetical protein